MQDARHSKASRSAGRMAALAVLLLCGLCARPALADTETPSPTGSPTATPTTTATVTPSSSPTPKAEVTVLAVVVVPSPQVFNNQSITAVLTVSNSGDVALNHVKLKPWTFSGTAGDPVELDSQPAEVDLAPGESAAFTWIGELGLPGSLRLRGSVQAAWPGHGQISSSIKLSNQVDVLSAPFTATRTRTASFSPSPTRTDSATASPTSSPSASPSASPTPTPTATLVWPLCVSEEGAAGVYYRVLALAGGGVLEAGNQGGARLRRYDAAGTLLWSRTYTSGGTIALALGEDGSGNLYASLTDGHVLSTDASGAPRWSRSVAYSDSLAVASDGRYAVADSGIPTQIQAWDGAGSLLWQRADTNAFVFNTVYDACGRLWVPDDAGTLWCYGAGGALEKSFSLPGKGRDIAVDAQGRLVVAVLAGTDTKVVRLLQDGTVEGSVTVPNTQPWGVSVDPSGGFQVTGDTGCCQPSWTSGQHAFVAAFHEDFSPAWSWTGPLGRGESVAAEANGAVWMAGWNSPNAALTERFCPGALGAALPSAACPSPTFSRTPSPTRSPSSTVSPTRSPSPGPSATPSATPTSSPTETPTVDLTWCAYQTQTAEAQATPTPSATNTETASPSPSATPSSTETDSETATPPPSALPTATPSTTGTATPSATESSPTASLTPALSATPSATVAAGPPSGGAPELLELRPFPHPSPRRFYVKLAADAADVEFVLHSAAGAPVGAGHSGPLSAPWAAWALPPDWRALPSGAYLLRVRARDAAGAWTQPWLGWIYILH